MSLPSPPSIDGETLYQLAGITGFGWTMSVLGFFGTVLGYGNSLLSRLVMDPYSFLYVGVVLFLATLGLDHFATEPSDEESADR